MAVAITWTSSASSAVLSNTRPPAIIARRAAQCPEPFERVPYLSHIGYMTADEVAKGLEAGDGRACGRQPLIDPDLSLAGPEMGSSRRRNGSRGKAALSSDLDAGQAPEGSLAMEAIFVCGSCVQ